ncbi:MAG: hypothetical protein AAFU64_16205 [Bacteroidota bacterium]
MYILFPSCQSESPEEKMLGSAIDYLWHQQGEDGGWHSAEHGILRGGQAYTPFILDALLSASQNYPFTSSRVD